MGHVQRTCKELGLLGQRFQVRISETAWLENKALCTAASIALILNIIVLVITTIMAFTVCQAFLYLFEMYDHLILMVT